MRDIRTCRGLDQIPVGSCGQLGIGGRLGCDGSVGEGDAIRCEALTLSGVQSVFAAVGLGITVNLGRYLYAAVGVLDSTIAEQVGGVYGIIAGGVDRALIIDQDQSAVDGSESDISFQAVCIGLLRIGQQLPGSHSRLQQQSA